MASGSFARLCRKHGISNICHALVIRVSSPIIPPQQPSALEGFFYTTKKVLDIVSYFLQGNKKAARREGRAANDVPLEPTLSS
jgi:hypothetical protein